MFKWHYSLMKNALMVCFDKSPLRLITSVLTRIVVILRFAIKMFAVKAVVIKLLVEPKHFARISKIVTRQTRSVYPWSLVC